MPIQISDDGKTFYVSPPMPFQQIYNEIVEKFDSFEFMRQPFPFERVGDASILAEGYTIEMAGKTYQRAKIMELQ